jgi:hypothetical protein
VRRARSERLHQDRVGTVGPKPIVEQDNHSESDRTPTEGARRGPPDLPGRKNDPVEGIETDYLYE